ncbi:MAG: 50S ribosomal protein L35 [Puniceicoccales bacterium]|jgi:large subunit ribosomal protein L35|nr:50S ribosomal protein L35 [Puniceicoccales bacterium]
MLKTKKSISKRFKITGSGKILHRMPGHRHFLRTKTVKQRRAAHQDRLISTGFQKQILRAISVGL